MNLSLYLKKRGKKQFRYRELNPDRRGTEFIVKFMKALSANHYTISDDLMLFGNSKNYMLVGLDKEKVS